MEDPRSEYGQLFVEDTELCNRIVLGSFLPQGSWAPLPRFFQTWLRNYIGGVLIYLISPFLWCFYIYYWKRNVYVPRVADFIPSCKGMLLQISVAMKAMPWYSVLPTLSEYLTEIGWTKSFPRIYNVGWLHYISYLAIYLITVELVYCMNGVLHDKKPLDEDVHPTDHTYNKQNTLSPFAALAFHPLGEILQALPHSLALFIVPIHFTAYLVLLLMEAVSTAIVRHYCIHGKLWPGMCAVCHTIHHTTYCRNYGHYGHYTKWLVRIFETLHEVSPTRCLHPPSEELTGCPPDTPKPDRRGSIHSQSQSQRDKPAKSQEQTNLRSPQHHCPAQPSSQPCPSPPGTAHKVINGDSTDRSGHHTTYNNGCRSIINSGNFPGTGNGCYNEGGKQASSHEQSNLPHVR